MKKLWTMLVAFIQALVEPIMNEMGKNLINISKQMTKLNKKVITAFNKFEKKKN